MEVGFRGYHFFKYGDFFPIYGQAVFYDPSFKNLVEFYNKEHWERERLQDEKCELYLSGGSVAWGFGISEDGPTPKNLISEKLGKFVCLSAFPGIVLEEEFGGIEGNEFISFDSELVFLSGFNDSVFLSYKRHWLMKKIKLFFFLPLVNKSLVFHKLYDYLNLVFEQSFGGQENAELHWKKIVEGKLETFFKTEQSKNSYMFFQPYLSENKRMTDYEIKKLEQYPYTIDRRFYVRREWLVSRFKHYFGKRFLDLQPWFLDKQGDFSDICHLTETGNEKAVNLMIQFMNKHRDDLRLANASLLEEPE
jgi:hypothetical protein